MAVYNAEKYLRQALDTVVNQTLKDIEIILVDDLSTDGSYGIMQEYAERDGRIRLVQHKEKTYSAAAARNIGLDLARGEYVSVLDGDDFFELDMLEKAYLRGKKIDADIVMFDAFVYREAVGKKENVGWLLDRRILPHKEVFSSRDCGKNLFFIKGGMAWNSLNKRTFLRNNNIKFFEVYHAQDDWVFTYLSLALANRMTALTERLMSWRRRGNDSQSRVGESYPEGAYLIVDVLMEELKGRGIYEDFVIPLANRAIVQGEGKLLVAGDYKLFENIHTALQKYLVKFGADRLLPSQFTNKNFLAWRDIVLHGTARNLIDEWYLPRKLGQEAQSLLYGFPWGDRVVIYGGGDRGKQVFKWFTGWPFCRVAGWVDRGYAEHGYPVQSPEILRQGGFDAILVAVESEGTFCSISSQLQAMGIETGRIIWLFRNPEARKKAETLSLTGVPKCGGGTPAMRRIGSATCGTIVNLYMTRELSVKQFRHFSQGWRARARPWCSSFWQGSMRCTRENQSITPRKRQSSVTI